MWFWVVYLKWLIYLLFVLCAFIFCFSRDLWHLSVSDQLSLVCHFSMKRLQIIEFYYKKLTLCEQCVSRFNGWDIRLSGQTIKAVVYKFQISFTVLDIIPSRMRVMRTEENIAAVAASLKQDRNLSIRRRSHQLGHYSFTAWKVLRRDCSSGVLNTARPRMVTGPKNSLPRSRFFTKTLCLEL